MIHFNGAIVAALSHLAALSIVEDPNLGARRIAVREHKKRRNQSWAYHRRIDKKWRKRYGEFEAPAWYASPRGSIFVNRPMMEALRGMSVEALR